MIRSRTVNKLHELAGPRKSIQDMAITLGIARNTVRKYLRHPELVAMPHPRPNRRSKLDPFKEPVRRWITEDHCYNCEAMLPRLLEMGYTGSLSVLKAFVHPLRPQACGCAPVIRYETKPGEQVQFDWGEFKYEQDGVARKLYGFSAILCYSRMRFVTFVKRCDVQTLIRCLMEAFEYFGGLPKAALTDRMKSVLVDMEEKKPRWNARFADFMASIGVAPRVCKAYTPQTKGKIERTIGFVKKNFWPGIAFTEIDDLNRQAASWCERINARVHGTTHERSSERREQEPLAPFPQAFAWERFATEERHPWGGMATSPTMESCTACLLPLHWPVPWSSYGSGMASSRCGREDSSLLNWPSAPGPRPMWSTRTNFVTWKELPPAGCKAFPWAICGPRQRCRRAPGAEYDQLCGLEVLACSS
jgi:transposase